MRAMGGKKVGSYRIGRDNKASLKVRLNAVAMRLIGSPEALDGYVTKDVYMLVHESDPERLAQRRGGIYAGKRKAGRNMLSLPKSVGVQLGVGPGDMVDEFVEMTPKGGMIYLEAAKE